MSGSCTLRALVVMVGVFVTVVHEAADRYVVPDAVSVGFSWKMDEPSNQFTFSRKENATGIDK